MIQKKGPGLMPWTLPGLSSLLDKMGWGAPLGRRRPWTVAVRLSAGWSSAGTLLSPLYALCLALG